MKKTFISITIILLVLIVDRFLFMEKRLLNNLFEFERGVYVGDPISASQNIKLKNNFEIQISKNENSKSFYVLGIYFGELYLLEKGSLRFTEYAEF
ncbi:MAG: hypothetical protein ABWY22_13730 [Flavobacterium sp.]